MDDDKSGSNEKIILQHMLWSLIDTIDMHNPLWGFHQRRMIKELSTDGWSASCQFKLCPNIEKTLKTSLLSKIKAYRKFHYHEK